MGKTIQAISLLLANRPAKDNALQAKQWQLSDERSQTSIKPSMRGGTLIVLPVIAMGQVSSYINFISHLFKLVASSGNRRLRALPLQER